MSLGVAAIALALGATTGLAAAPTAPIAPGPALTPVSAWAWVVDRSPSVTRYSPGAKDHGSSNGGAAQVVRTRKGVYTVRFSGVGQAGGIALVTTFDTHGRICVLDGWHPNKGREIVYVSCSTRSGALADTGFIASWYRLDGPTGSPGQAHLWASQPLTTDYEPIAAYNFNSMGSTNLVHRNGVGDYLVTLKDMAFAGGNVQVSAYADDAICRAVGWDPDGPDEVVRVICRSFGGATKDAVFAFAFTNNNGTIGWDRPIAYAWADRPAAASYTPDTDYQYSDPGVTLRILRSAKGTYAVRMTDGRLGGSVQVTAYGSGKTRCNVTSIRRTGTPQEVGVACYGPSGARADSPFTFSWAR